MPLFRLVFSVAHYSLQTPAYELQCCLNSKLSTAALYCAMKSRAGEKAQQSKAKKWRKFFETGEARVSFDGPIWWKCDLEQQEGVSIGRDITVQIMRLWDKKIVNMGNRGQSEYVQPSHTNDGDCMVEWGDEWSSGWPHV